jgi:asparagine synthase (glutamine-hydrolysing)
VCGIAGKVSEGEPIAPGLIEAMCERQAHRGPDSRGVHRAPGAELGVQRLRVIDLDTGDQPIYSEDRSVAVILNGEIYNFRELRRELERRGHRFATKGDTEVIAHLYEEHGAELVHRLDGMFAFAVWDARRRSLLLARDRVGKKPLFYAEGDDWLSFASELGALTSDDSIARALDPASIQCYLAYGYIPAPWSVWRDVRKLPPAHLLVWERGRSRIERYWSLDYSRKRGESPRELEEELRRRVGAAVRRRMVADVPVGVFLSGGVDSSIVAAEMAAASGQPVKTFSIGFEDGRYDELPRARAVARHLGADHHEFVVKPDAISILPKLVRHYGEPFADSSALPSFYLAELTRRQVTVALNGDGGDESFAGYLRHVANRAVAPIDRVSHRLRRPVASAAGRLPAGADGRGIPSYARRLLQSVDLDGVDRYTDHVSVFTAAELDRLLAPGFRDGADPTRPRRVIRRAWYTAACDSSLDQLLSVDVNAYLPYDLLVKMDIATMAASLEARSPLLDRGVMEFAASLPARSKVSLFRKKWLLRRAYRDRLPAKTMRGRKQGFAVPLDSWLRHELRDYVREALLGPTALTRSYVSPAAVETMLGEHLAGRADRSAKLWSLLMLELWHQSVATPARA